MEPVVKVQEEGRKGVVENQEARFWGTWNPHGYPVVKDDEDDLIHCYGTHAHLYQKMSKRESLPVSVPVAYSLKMS